VLGSRPPSSTSQKDDRKPGWKTLAGFPPQVLFIFSDAEEGGRLPSTYFTYLKLWASEISRLGSAPASIVRPFRLMKAKPHAHHLRLHS